MECWSLVLTPRHVSIITSRRFTNFEFESSTRIVGVGLCPDWFVGTGGRCVWPRSRDCCLKKHGMLMNLTSVLSRFIQLTIWRVISVFLDFGRRSQRPHGDDRKEPTNPARETGQKSPEARRLIVIREANGGRGRSRQGPSRIKFAARINAGESNTFNGGARGCPSSLGNLIRWSIMPPHAFARLFFSVDPQTTVKVMPSCGRAIRILTPDARYK